jgi:hypothetical protein
MSALFTVVDFTLVARERMPQRTRKRADNDHQAGTRVRQDSVVHDSKQAIQVRSPT